jgi:hypothetical protein
LEALLRVNIHPISWVIAGLETIGRNYGIRVGEFPAILFRILESFALKFLVKLSKYFANILSNLCKYFLPKHPINSSAQPANEFYLNSKL